MDYQEILQVIKLQNPDMPQKEAQKKASEKHKLFKAAAKALAAESTTVGPVATTKVEEAKAATIAIGALRDVEQHIREIGINKNNICLYGSKLMPDGELVKHGRIGVNTEVSFEDPSGNKIPVDGYFLIWI